MNVTPETVQTKQAKHRFILIFISNNTKLFKNVIGISTPISGRAPKGFSLNWESSIQWIRSPCNLHKNSIKLFWVGAYRCLQSFQAIWTAIPFHPLIYGWILKTEVLSKNIILPCFTFTLILSMSMWSPFTWIVIIRCVITMSKMDRFLNDLNCFRIACTYVHRVAVNNSTSSG